MTYQVAVSFQSALSNRAVAVQLQELFDTNGVAGRFLVTGTGFVKECLFEREAAEDQEYIQARVPASAGRSAYCKAAVAQLVAELTEFDPPAGLRPLIKALESGKAVVAHADTLMRRAA